MNEMEMVEFNLKKAGVLSEKDKLLVGNYPMINHGIARIASSYHNEYEYEIMGEVYGPNINHITIKESKGIFNTVSIDLTMEDLIAILDDQIREREIAPSLIDFIMNDMIGLAKEQRRTYADYAKQMDHDMAQSG